jgi:hypothetical protein
MFIFFQPLDINFNHRIDMMNADSRTKRAYQDAGEKKQSLRADLARGFTIQACKKY